MKKKIIISVCAVLILAAIFGVCSALVTPKYTDEKHFEGRLSGEYYAEAGGHDVLFIGDCEVYESFVPAILWEKYGISSYVRGTPQQLAWHSYYLLEEMLEYETPKAVVYNVLALKYGEPQDEAMNRMTLDGMKWSFSKARSVLASMTEEENFLDYVFPLLRYHSRITELEVDDLKYAFSDPETVSNSGYLMKTGIAPMPEDMKDQTGSVIYDEILPEKSMEYLEKMRTLCEDRGVELILIKAPTNAPIYWWYDEWDAQICDYAEEKGLSYYNLIPLCEEIGIDWNTDTYDQGVHLNVYGAEKTSVYFGNILATAHGVPDRRADAELYASWNGRIEKYYSDKKAMEEKETDNR